MLADDEDGVDGQLVTPLAQGFGDGRIDLEAARTGSLTAQVAGRLLIDVRRDDVHLGPVPLSLVRVADEEPVADVLGVRLVDPERRDQGHAFPLAG